LVVSQVVIVHAVVVVVALGFLELVYLVLKELFFFSEHTFYLHTPDRFDQQIPPCFVMATSLIAFELSISSEVSTDFGLRVAP
jgi:hypothetical protein